MPHSTNMWSDALDVIKEGIEVNLIFVKKIINIIFYYFCFNQYLFLIVQHT
jgi:hypothetical protein